MLRFPYLLSLLLCIELSFCYNYIEETTEHNRNNFGRNIRRERIRRVKRPNVRRSPIRQEEDYDRSPVEFDVARFIQPETENFEEGEGLISHNGNRRSWSEKPFDIGPVIKTDDINNKLEKTPDLMSMGDSLPDLSMNPPLSKDSWNSKHFGYNPLEEVNAGKYGHEKFRNIYKDDSLMNQNVAHNQKKKCSLKSIKFPFFSHNKSEIVKPSKTKKRRLFFFNNSKKDVSKVPDFNKMKDDTMIPYKMKRSYEQRLCPACKKIFVGNIDHERPKKNPINFIHNSRQFFRNILPDATPNEEIKDFRTNKIANFDERYRMKRSHDTDRQLKELEEVQRKIDAVEIRVLQSNRPVERKV